MRQNPIASDVEPYKIPLVDESGKTIGYGDRWWTHRVRDGSRGETLGQKHIGITIACIDDEQRILVQKRRHRIFDNVWSLSGDTHPRKYGNRRVETLYEAARRCAKEDLGVAIKRWNQSLSLSYSARDPRNPRYCENELLYILVANLVDQVHMNEKNVYELQWATIPDISEESSGELGKRPIDRKYAPWVHAVFSLPLRRQNKCSLYKGKPRFSPFDLESLPVSWNRAS